MSDKSAERIVLYSQLVGSRWKIGLLMKLAKLLRLKLENWITDAARRVEEGRG